MHWTEVRAVGETGRGGGQKSFGADDIGQKCRWWWAVGELEKSSLSPQLSLFGRVLSATKAGLHPTTYMIFFRSDSRVPCARSDGPVLRGTRSTPYIVPVQTPQAVNNGGTSI